MSRAALRLASALAIAVEACGGPEPPASVGDAPQGEDTAGAFVHDSLPPAAQPGFLAARTDDPSQLGGAWAARAGECPSPPSLQVMAESDSVGVLVLIAYPDSGPRTTVYRVVLPDSAAPSPGTARLGVQRIQYLALAYRGVGGWVALSDLGRRVTGRFDVTLADVTTQRELRYVGSFRDVRIEPWPRDLCALEARTDSAAADSVR